MQLFSTCARFGTAGKITLADLKIDLMFPSDAATGAALRHLAAGD